MMLHAVDFLIVFMTLAGYEHDVARLGEGRTGKILAGLCALRQLNLVELARDEQASVYRAVRTTEKKDLASAPILHSLEVSR